ncbi:MAG TPA: hypothetical protein VH061_12620 [Solirubrobacteraceae bacterium]|nr:hypothetical protein [Solirubrobacteraceae bacterium]
MTLMVALALVAYSTHPAGAEEAHRHSGGGPAKAHAISCLPAPGRVLQENDQAEIYLLRDAEGLPDEVWACSVTHSVVRHLGRLLTCRERSTKERDCSGIADPVLAAGLVGFDEVHESFFPAGPESEAARYYVYVKRLVTGLTLRIEATGQTPPPDSFAVDSGPTVAVRLQADGAVAWIAQPSDQPYELVAVDDRGHRRLVAAGSDIEPGSLRLQDHVLSWLQGGTIHTTPLA